MPIARTLLLLFVLVYLVPLALSALRYRMDGTGADWQSADRSSSQLLPPVARPGAVLRIFAAQTVRWRGIFATHCWVVLKPDGADTYTRYDYTAWGDPVRTNGFEPDGRWFGRLPLTVLAIDGPAAAAMIPAVERAVADYPFRRRGDYVAWPGPNSNTFVAAVLDAIPDARVALPPTAIGRDFPYDGRWLRPTASRTGLRLTLGGYLTLTVAWVEGIELGILGATAGLDLMRPGIKLPGLGRFGV